MIQFNIKPGSKVIELGGGECPQFRPNVDVRQCFGPDGNPTVDFTANFDGPLPIKSEEWDAVFAHFVIEHISWRSVRLFISEVFRILKPGGKAIMITANTEAQMKWVLEHDEWDDQCSCIIFGDQNYPENTHRNAFSPKYAQKLFGEAGFTGILTRPYGEINTDMCIEAVKPEVVEPVISTQVQKEETLPTKEIPGGMTREEMFDKDYFGGGGKVGGYAREGYWDYPQHEITVRHILARRPESVLEIGAARGYIVKRLQDHGVLAYGLEISKHCEMTAVCTGIVRHDLCKTPWDLWDLPPSFRPPQFDLIFSIAVMEHIPEQFLPAVFEELKRLGKRGLHGIDFGQHDDGFDKTHCTLKPKEWWQQRMPPGHEVVDKEELERGNFPQEVLSGDGKVKLNIGCFQTMYHYGWVNIDIHDLGQWANSYGYKFQRADVREGLPYDTASVDLIMLCHMLEHLTYDEGLAFLRECRRIIKPNGVIRIIVPDANLLNNELTNLSDFDEINEGCANAETIEGKRWALLHAGHSAAYDDETLRAIALKAGFDYRLTSFRQCISKQMLQETLDLLPCLSLYADLVPHGAKNDSIANEG